MRANYASQAVNTARDYYNSDDADNFYFNIWGGKDIHVGMYETPDEAIPAASHRTIERMVARMDRPLDAGTRVLDVGAGYGGAARHLAKTFGCHVVALNLSETENARGRAMNKEQGLDHLVEVVDASFEDIPYPDASFDVAWSQDAILHSGARAKVVEEIARVLRPGAELVMTDPMRADDCPDGVLQPILDRLHLQTLGSPGFYHDTAARCGLTDLGFEDHTAQLTRHYARVLEELERHGDSLRGKVSDEYIENMKTGLRHWVQGGQNGHLAWGILHFRKP